jgi:hypothetical protein
LAAPLDHFGLGVSTLDDALEFGVDVGFGADLVLVIRPL